MATAPNLGDFYVLPIRMPQMPSLATTKPATHFVYVRPHTPKIPSARDERSLFLTNVPVDSTEAAFRAVFASLVGAGRFESITFQDEGLRKQNGGGDGGIDNDDSEDDSDTAGALLPGNAARIAALQSRKRKREGGGRADEARKAAAADRVAEKKAALPETWPRRLRRSGSTAVVLLADTSSVRIVLQAITKLAGGSTKDKTIPEWPASSTNQFGPAWIAAHNRLTYPDPATVKASVDAFFELYNRREAEAATAAKRLRNEPDADGFVTVTSGGGSRHTPARREEAEAARAKQQAKQQAKQEGMPNFYRFQLRDKKKAEQMELLRKFEEDRKRVAETRGQQGKFRPEV